MVTNTIQISGLPETVIQDVSDRAKAVGATAEEYVHSEIAPGSSVQADTILKSLNK